LEEVTDLTRSDYTFTYLENINDRLYLSFLITDVSDIEVDDTEEFYAYAQNKLIKVVLTNSNSSKITIYNLLGQIITSKDTHSTESVFTIDETGYYIVKVSNESGISTQKVFVN
jgi:hypothetical protein